MFNTEFSTTAMCRPELVDRTYESFCTQITDVDFENSTLYLNIDPAPVDVDPMTVVEVAKKYFGNVVHRTPVEANFTSAVQWCWSQVKGKYVFHLEDDWVLHKKILFGDMVELMKNPKVIQVYLRAIRRSGKDSRNKKKVRLSPSLIDGNFAKLKSKNFDVLINPEVQLRGHDGISINFGTEFVIQDIGREWLGASGYRRPKGKRAKREFTKWLNRD